MHTPAERQRYAQRIHAYERTPAWHARADRYRRDYGNTCEACGARGVDVHHRSYKNAFFGTEPDEDLRGLCRDDHMRVHALAWQGWTLADATDTVIGGPRRTTLYPWWRWVAVAAVIFALLLVVSAL